MYRPPGAAPFSRSTWWYMHDSVSHAQELGGSSGSLGGSRSSGSGNSSSDAARELAGDEEDPA